MEQSKKKKKKYRSVTSKGEITTLNFHTLFIKISQIYPPTIPPFPHPDKCPIIHCHDQVCPFSASILGHPIVVTFAEYGETDGHKGR